jgi:hypothetical protein
MIKGILNVHYWVDPTTLVAFRRNIGRISPEFGEYLVHTIHIWNEATAVTIFPAL